MEMYRECPGCGVRRQGQEIEYGWDLYWVCPVVACGRMLKIGVSRYALEMAPVRVIQSGPSAGWVRVGDDYTLPDGRLGKVTEVTSLFDVVTGSRGFAVVQPTEPIAA